MPIEIQPIADLVRRIALDELPPRFCHICYELKADGSMLTEADLAMNRRLRGELKARFPDVRFLSEEMSAEHQQEILASGQPSWCLDPLDGTSNFVAGIPYFGVSLALIEQGRPTLAVIYDPNRDELFTARAGAGAQLNGRPLRLPEQGLPLCNGIAMVDLKRLERGLRNRILDEQPFGSQRNFGSCALEWGWLAAGRGHAYLHGGQKLWDIAAGVLILEEAGGHACTLDGEPVFRASLTPRSAVASPYRSVFEEWCDWLGVPR